MSSFVLLGGVQSIKTDSLGDKRIALIISFINFDYYEYKIVKSRLEKKGEAISVFSSKPGLATSINRKTVKVDFVVDDLVIDHFDGIIFCGGDGLWFEFLHNPKAHN